MNTKKTAALIIGTLFLLIPTVKAQSKFHIILDYHYNLGVCEKYWGRTFDRGEYKMHGNSLHFTALYDITQKISAGVGIGADRYEEPGYNTFPVYGTFRYRPVPKFLNGYVFTDLGYGLFKNDNVAPGWMWNAGIGYTKMFRKHFGLNFQLGYNLKEFGGIPSYEVDLVNGEFNFIGKKSSIRHSVSFGFGLVF